MKKIYLIGKNVPSSKNSKQITKYGKIIPSKLTREYVDWALPLLQEQLPIWQEMIEDVNGEQPLKVMFTLHRDSHRHYDFINVLQVLQDLLVKASYLEDDDTKHIIPYYGGEDVVNKEQSGVEITILKTV